MDVLWFLQGFIQDLFLGGGNVAMAIVSLHCVHKNAQSRRIGGMLPQGNFKIYNLWDCVWSNYTMSYILLCIVYHYANFQGGGEQNVPLKLINPCIMLYTFEAA